MKLIKFWLNYFKFGIVEEDLTAVEADPVIDTPLVEEPAEPVETADDYVDKATDLVDELKPNEEVKPELEKEAEKLEKKPLSDEDLKPLNSTNKSTNERFEKLTSSYREVTAENEQLKQKYDTAEAAFADLRQLGFDDDNSIQSLVEFSEYRNAIKSGDADKFSQMIANEIQQFELMTGKRVNVNTSGIDKYQDLRERVDAKQISEEDALRLARFNNLEERAAIQNQTRYNEVTERQQQEQAINTAYDSVLSIQNNLQKTDPDYQVVVNAMQPFIAELTQSLPPAQWAKAIEVNYKVTKAALLNLQPAKQTFAPLRANSAKGGKPVFKTVDEQIAHELDDENWSAA